MIAIIVAIDLNNTIGKNNSLPWHLPADLAYFKTVTMGHPIVMGRKTHEAIGRPLPGRQNIILTRDPGYEAEGCTIAHSVDEILDTYINQDLFVIGGAEVIKTFLPYTDKLYVTRIEERFEGDVFLPQIKSTEWRIVSSRQGITDVNNPYTYYFLIYERKR
ncbi:dihydrofolate reductase [Aneurinibacillus sp. Ricciae_BoGa-3]|uniref:dihydrofolate reductase n=1 Tax=Aneurinibacillus sp. Ricciae_BoGa-3 TaxID=3022697 RepID=UPI002340400C|nr:dihydrofolate reductase [Aneurinibacillus sp. Ricciae_BoGa-3]WCK53394.1 dihydrofolate reductase [Aneurinibacillus sp. Ricciae_BoGa-3]